MWGAIAILGMIVFFFAGWWLIESRRKFRIKPRLDRYLIAAPVGMAFSAIFVVAMFAFGLLGNESSAKPGAKETKGAGLGDKEIESLFTIMDEMYLPDRRTVEVRLHRRVSEAVLEKIAARVKEMADNVDQTFIGYRLGSQESNSTYWATTHYSPELTVRIAGLTTREVESLRAFDVEDHYDDAIGSWIVESGFNHLAIAYIEDNQVFMDHVFPGEEVVTKEYRTSELVNGGLRLQAVDDTFGDYFTVGVKGNLRYWSENENYMTASPLDPDAVNLELSDVELTSSLPPKRAALVMTGSDTLANDAKFNGRGHAACATEESLDEMLRAAIDSDQRGISRLLDRDCVTPRAGVPVSVLMRTPGGKVHVRAQEKDKEREYWTVADALSGNDS